MRLSSQTAAECLFIALAPIAGFFALHVSLINQDMTVDPWFYTGYGQEFKVLVEEFGWTYYAVRFPVILLNLSVSWIHDPVIGFAILRYLIFLSCGVPLYLWARRHFGVIYAVAAYLFLICNPLFPRLLLWDLTPFVSIPMALAGITLWQLSAKPNALQRALSGFAFCASVASHAFTGTAIAAFFLVETVRRLLKREWSQLILLDVVAPLVGAFVCLAVGIGCYYLILGRFDPLVFVTMTLNAIRAGDTYSSSHSSSISIWIWRDTYIFIPPLLVGFVAIGFARDLLKDTIVARMWWFGFSYCVGYAVYQFVFQRFVLQIFFYYFHLTLVVYLLFPASLYLITRKLTPTRQLIAVVAAMAALIVAPLFKGYFTVPPGDLEAGFAKFALLAALCAFMISAVILSIRFMQSGPVLASFYAIALVFTIQVLALSAPPYMFASVYANPSQGREYDVYRAAVQMVRLFGRYAKPSERVRLWYPDNEHSAWSIASTVLMHTVNKPYEHQGGLPNIGDYETSRFRSSKVIYIMMISESPKLIAEGKHALVHHGYEYRELEHRTIGGMNFKVGLDLIELIDPVRDKAMAQGRSLPLSAMTVFWSRASLQPSPVGIAFRSAPDIWSYIGQMPLSAGCISGGGWVEVKIRVTRGAAAVGVSDRKGENFLVRVPLLHSEKSQTIFLRLDVLAAAGDLVLQNWDEGPSEGILQAVRIGAEHGPMPPACDLRAHPAATAQPHG